MRIFVGIDLDPEMRARIQRFQEHIEGFASGARWMQPESLHITLKFIGEQTPEQVEALAERLRKIEANAIEIRAAGYGFFPTLKSPRVFWVGIHAGSQLSTLATAVDIAAAELGIPSEGRAYNPHLTLARAGGKSGAPQKQKGDGPNQTFTVLQKELSRMEEPDFGSLTAVEFILYRSQLSPQGSRYTKLQRFPLQTRP